MSVAPKTGIREYSCGATTDQLAAGWSGGFIEEYHRYLNAICGFLCVTVERLDGIPNIVFSFRDVNGLLRYADRYIVNDDRLVKVIRTGGKAVPICP